MWVQEGKRNAGVLRNQFGHLGQAHATHNSAQNNPPSNPSPFFNSIPNLVRSCSEKQHLFVANAICRRTTAFQNAWASGLPRGSKLRGWLRLSQTTATPRTPPPCSTATQPGLRRPSALPGVGGGGFRGVIPKPLPKTTTKFFIQIQHCAQMRRRPQQDPKFRTDVTPSKFAQAKFRDVKPG